MQASCPGSRDWNSLIITSAPWPAKGEGEPTGETIAVEFGLEEENGVREIFEQYEITESEEDTGNHMTFYRHR